MWEPLNLVKVAHTLHNKGMKKPKTNLNTYVIYLRKSREEEEGTLEHHRSLCLDFAAKHQFPISKIYEEIVSGKETESNRPTLAEFLTDAKARQFCGVIVFDVDRFSRDKYLQPNILMNLKNLGIKVFTIKAGGEVKYETATDELTLNLLALFADFEYNQIKFRYAQGKAASCMAGNFLGTHAPYGYRKVQYTEGGRLRKSLEIYEPEAEVVRRVFAYKLEGWSLWQICRQFSSEGIKTQFNRDWTTTTLHHMLKNEVYYGCVYWGKYKTEVIQDGLERRTKQVKAEPGTYLLKENAHPGIVSKETWEKVQPLISTTPNTQKPITNVLSGLIKCHYCGYAYSADKRKVKCKNGDIHLHVRYSHSLYVYECEHRTASLKQEIVICEVIKQIKQQIENLQSVAKIDKQNPFELERQRIKNLLEKRKQEKDSLWGEFMQGVTSIPAELREEFRANLMQSITEKNDVIDRLEQELQSIPVYTETPTEKVLTLYQALDYLENWETYPGELLDLNMFLKSIIKRIEVYPDTQQLEIIWAGTPDGPDEWKFNKNSVIRHKKGEPGYKGKKKKKDKGTE